MDTGLFKNPPNEFREVPLWSWNDDLDPDELRRQIALMDEGGWGGFFMHVRVGLETSYLGPKFMECVRACVEEAHARGMYAWIYDEDRWPSGFAGGLTVAPEPDHRMQYMLCKVDNRLALVSERLITFSAKEVDGMLGDFCRNDSPNLASDQDRLVQFFPQPMPLGIPWFNDYAYLALLNPDAVRAFLESTYELYAEEVGDYFGGTVPGIFTDEPSILYGGGSFLGLPAVPWTADLGAYFQERNGYDLLAHLPSLFFDVGEYHRVRYDYWRAVTERFVESFTKQIYDWCEDHNLAFTGHFMAEDTLLGQIQWIGAAMPHYPYQHIPGIDKLHRWVNEGAGTVLTFKQLDSAVCQLGKPRAFCENYGCAGQDFAHAGRKWIGDWSYVLGVNFNDPHIPLYSMRGERKRDCPQALSYQQPWWPDHRLIADYMGRLSYALSQGQRVVDVLVLHPMGSAWSQYRPGATFALDELDRPLNDLGLALMRAQRDFHFADELLIEPGAPCEAQVVLEGNCARLRVGKMRYAVVIVPPSVTWTMNTVRLLREFAAAGGAVLAMEPRPTMVDCKLTEEPVLPGTTRLVSIEGLPSVLDEVFPFDVLVPGHPDIWAHHRRDGDCHTYFLANTDVDAGAVATVFLRGTGRLEVWDLTTGEVRTVVSNASDGVTQVTLRFAPAGSHLLALREDASPVEHDPAPERILGEVPLAEYWDLALGGPNALTVDTAQYRVGGSHVWSEPLHILDAHAAVIKAGDGAPFALRFLFSADCQVQPPVYLVVERPERFSITLNGQPVENTDRGWWRDISFRKVEISDAIRAGQNELVLSGTFRRDTELESVYVIGDFGVSASRLREENRLTGQVFDRYSPQFLLTSAPQSVRAGGNQGGCEIDLTSQGMPFLAETALLRQSVDVAQPFRRAELELYDVHAAVVRVRVNHHDAGAIAWPPHVIDVTEVVRAGANLVEVELVGTLRNLLGPHHLNGGDLSKTVPETFRDKSRWTDDYMLVPFGIGRAVLRLYG